MGRDKKRPEGYSPLLEFYLRKKREGGSLLVPSVFHGNLDAIARRECLVLIHGFNNAEGEAAAAYFGFRGRQTDIFQPAVIVSPVRFLEAFTIYTRVGDVFAYASVVITLVMLMLVRRIQ